VILGHSERRTLFGETDALIARKVSIALETGLTPILCIGEDLKVRDSGRADAFLADQIKAAAAGVGAGDVILAYEPIWAIGTGRNATGKMCAETTQEIRESVRRFWPSRYENVPVLYGGSVTPDNVAELVGEGQIDGFLVGGASLDSGKFLAIHRALGGL
jgi:triosephosphate isomerase (TIM)